MLLELPGEIVEPSPALRQDPGERTQLVPHGSSPFAGTRPHHTSDRRGDLFPFRFSVHQLLPTERRQSVILELAVAVAGSLPRRDDPVFALHSVECRIQRPVLNLQHVVGRALDVARDFVTMCRTEEQSPEDEHIERALQQLRAGTGGRHRW